MIAEGEMRRGTFYHTKGSNPAAANRLQALTDQYPLYSSADEANMLLGDSYSKMGNRFRQKSGEAFARVVREYPLSPLCGQMPRSACNLWKCRSRKPIPWPMTG